MCWIDNRSGRWCADWINDCAAFSEIDSIFTQDMTIVIRILRGSRWAILRFVSGVDSTKGHSTNRQELTWLQWRLALDTIATDVRSVQRIQVRNKQ